MNVLLKFFASGSYNIIYIYANELFPTRIRNTGMGICSMVARKDKFFLLYSINIVSLGIGAIAGTTSNDILVCKNVFSIEIIVSKVSTEIS
jgi:hypothetical protein